MTDSGFAGPSGPLLGLKIVEFGEATAGPMAGSLLADFGATVVHVEHPRSGDSHRHMGPARNGAHLWWKVSGRNKRSVTVNLSTSQGQAIAHKLIAWADGVIGSFRPSVLEEWRLDWAHVHRINPQAVMLQVSGYGATSAKKDAPGFGKIGEARSGVTYLTGFPDSPPTHSGFSEAVTVTALMGSWAMLAALWRRVHDSEDFDGEWIDLALYEPLFRLIEWQVVLYDQLGIIPTRAGNRLPIAEGGVVNAYQSRDGDWITVSAPTRKATRTIAKLIGYEYGHSHDQDDDVGMMVDRELGAWLSERTTSDALEALAAAGVVASPILNVADIMRDPEYLSRADIVVVDDPDLGEVRMQAALPHMRLHPGRVWRPAPALGQDNELVFKEWLGISSQELEEQHSQGII